jgi:hypothetical protein
MAEEDKADWEIRLEKYFEEPVSEAKVDGTFSGSQLQSLLIDIEKVVGEAKKFLAASMISEVRAQLDKIRSLLRVLEKRASGSMEEIASLLKAGVSEKILKEIYGVAEEEIQKAKKLLEMMKKGSSVKWILVHDATVVFETGNYEEAIKKFYELQKEKGWYPPALAIFKQETTSSHSNPNSSGSPQTQEESITMQRIRCSNLYEALKALNLVLVRAREKKELELESAVSRAMELIAKKLEECPSEWYMESSSKHGSSSSNPDAEEQEYEVIREKARVARAESLI